MKVSYLPSAGIHVGKGIKELPLERKLDLPIIKS